MIDDWTAGAEVNTGASLVVPASVYWTFSEQYGPWGDIRLNWTGYLSAGAHNIRVYVYAYNLWENNGGTYVRQILNWGTFRPTLEITLL